MENTSPIEPFDPVDRRQIILLANLPPQKRVRTMLEARELVVGLIRGRLRRRYPDLPLAALNLKVIEEVSRAQQRPPRP
jgi:hypothetical protein